MQKLGSTNPLFLPSIGNVGTVIISVISCSKRPVDKKGKILASYQDVLKKCNVHAGNKLQLQDALQLLLRFFSCFVEKNHMQMSHTELLKCCKFVTPLETLQVLHND